MYNKEIKERFISLYTTKKSIIKLCVSVFDRFEQYEVEWNADLCTKTTEELQPVVDELLGLRARGRWTKLIILKSYVKWCIVANVDNACDGMLNVTYEGISQIKTHTVSRPRELQKYLDIICEPESRKATDNIYRCYYWLAYMGMEEEDILDVKTSDVDLVAMTVNYKAKDTVLALYPESFEAFKNCVELEAFTYVHPNNPKDTVVPRAPGDTLVRGTRSQTSTLSMRVELSRRSKNFMDKTEKKMSYSRVWLSGLFYRMYDRELDGVTPDFSVVVDEQMEGKDYKYSGRHTPHTKKLGLIREYEVDYERWKLAWYVGV